MCAPGARSYPRLFGEAVAQLAGQHLRPTTQPLENVSAKAQGKATLAWLQLLPGGTWADACLADIVNYLLTNKGLDKGNLV